MPTKASLIKLCEKVTGGQLKPQFVPLEVVYTYTSPIGDTVRGSMWGMVLLLPFGPCHTRSWSVDALYFSKADAEAAVLSEAGEDGFKGCVLALKDQVRGQFVRWARDSAPPMTVVEYCTLLSARMKALSIPFISASVVADPLSAVLVRTAERSTKPDYLFAQNDQGNRTSHSFSPIRDEVLTHT